MCYIKQYINVITDQHNVSLSQHLHLHHLLHEPTYIKNGSVIITDDKVTFWISYLNMYTITFGYIFIPYHIVGLSGCSSNSCEILVCNKKNDVAENNSIGFFWLIPDYN